MSYTSSTTMDEPGGQRSSAQAVSEYLDTFYRGDFAAARALVWEDFVFRGPFLQIDGADGFFAGAEGLRRIVRGYRPLRQWEDRDEVSTLYEVALETPAGTGSVLMSEWNTVRNGKLASARVVFDTGAFRQLVPQAGPPDEGSPGRGRQCPLDADSFV